MKTVSRLVSASNATHLRILHASVVPWHCAEVEGVHEERVEKERPWDDDEEGVRDLRQGRMVSIEFYDRLGRAVRCLGRLGDEERGGRRRGERRRSAGHAGGGGGEAVGVIRRCIWERKSRGSKTRHASSQLVYTTLRSRLEHRSVTDGPPFRPSPPGRVRRSSISLHWAVTGTTMVVDPVVESNPRDLCPDESARPYHVGVCPCLGGKH